MTTKGIKFDIYDRDGVKRIYIGVQFDGDTYNWGDSFGFIDPTEIKRQGWHIVPAAEWV